MRLEHPREVHLGYCTNIHAGETWPEVRANLERHLLAVRARAAPGRRFGVGLRLSGLAAAGLATPGELERFADFLGAHDLYVYTINGFPYGPFHGTRVKEEVYLPDWLEDERLRYSNRLASQLARLLPPDVTEGSVSTVPGAFHARASAAGAPARIAENLRHHLVHLRDLREATGKHISLALEPEPACQLETIDDAIAFFEAHLLGRDALERLGALAGVGRAEAARLVHTHLGVCLDACHAAVQYEAPGDAVARLHARGIRIPKIQLSAGLEARLEPGDDAQLCALEPYAEGVYLHQVVARSPAGVRRFVDLPDALADARAHPSSAPCTWRIHYHVPIFRERYGRFTNTQGELAELCRLIRAGSPAPHLEVETYCWDVLPPEHRAEGLVVAVARELEWALERLER